MTDEELRQEFLDEFCAKFMALDNDWDRGEDIREDIITIRDLCNRYLRESEDGKQRDNNISE